MKEEKYRLAVNSEDGRASLMVLVRALEIDDSGPFEIQCRNLLETDQPTLLIDLCGVDHVPSTVVTAIMSTHAQAGEQGRDLTVCCRKVVARILRQMLGNSLRILD